MGAEGHGGGGVRHDPLRQRGGLAARAAHELEPLTPERTRDQPGIIGPDRSTGQGREDALGGRDGQRPRLEAALSVGGQGDEGPLRVEEPHGVAHDLLHDAVELEGAREDVRQLLEGE